MNDLLVPLVVVSEVALIGLVVWLVARRLEQRAQLRAELHMKLLERFSSVQELEQFLSSETGRRLLGVYAMRSRSPLWRIVHGVQVGTALVVFGVGLIVAASFLGGKGPFVLGVLVVALGIGLLAAAAVGRKLVKVWGVDREIQEAPAGASVASASRG
jgi:hypothetical protein